jgi:magnesium-transporting ATPase (P-type)
MVFNAPFNNISSILWQWVLLVEETRVPGENHLHVPAASHWQTLSHNVLSSTPCLSGIQTTMTAPDKLCNKLPKTKISFQQKKIVKHWNFILISTSQFTSLQVLIFYLFKFSNHNLVQFFFQSYWIVIIWNISNISSSPTEQSLHWQFCNNEVKVTPTGGSYL